MGVTVVKVEVYSSSFGLQETIEGIASRVVKRGGYKDAAGSVGSEFGMIPGWGPVTFRVYGTTEADKSRVEGDVKAETGIRGAFGGGFSSSWRNLTSAFVSDVVVKTGSDAADVAKRTAQAVERGATGIGIGLGVGIILLGAAYLLVLRGGRT